MGGATRLLVVLTTPFPLLRHRCPSLLRLSRHRHCKPSYSQFHRLTCSPSNFHLPLSSPIKASQQQLHNQAASSLRNNDYFGESYGTADSGSSLAPEHSHPWPEWSRFIDNISASGSFDNRPGFDGSGGQGIDDEVEFKAVGELSPQFLIEVKACLAFARDRPNLLRLLSRRDIEVVVENGNPFLFQNAEDSVRKMKSFVVDNGTSVLDTNKAQMVDLMKYMLSYASNSMVSSEVNHVYNRDLTESSVRNLFAELFKLSYNAPGSNISSSVQNQKPSHFGQIRPSGQRVEMKKGDWICPRCNFMNFARNIKCLECQEARPKRQLTGGEWECPQCDFFNYGRNMNCLRCDCKRPGQISLSATNTMSGLEYGNGNNIDTSGADSRLAANEEKAQRWFSKISQLDSAADINSVIGDDDFPEIMPLRKGVNRFVVSTRKTQLERRLANTQYKRNLGNDGTPEPNDFQAIEETKASDMSTSQSVDGNLGHQTGLNQSDNNSLAGGHTTSMDNPPSISSYSSPQYNNFKGSGSGHVPFVPLPADMFAQKSENLNIEESKRAMLPTDAGSANSGGSVPPFSKPTAQTVSEDREKKEPAEKSERWFKKVAELHNVSDLTSAVSDEDFPEIMPMRKGENRFVVSKKKDRSLTSPGYKRRLAMELSGNTNFVPFVPFPPDYFAKKGKQQPDVANSMDKKNGEPSSSSEAEEKLEMSNGASSGLQSVDSVNESSVQNSSNNTIYGAMTSESSSQSHFNSQVDYRAGLGSQNSSDENKDHVPNSTKSSSLTSENQNSREQWMGKSLEGSAVKEPDPLDMSEEAKAERWFRRVAQIKDISELSQIPDEDFPSIMPMRKGVNRFVVSKRKTPLERRLTSQQYRRNLPVVNSDPVKNENEGS